MVMRSEGAGRPSAPSALAGMMVGAATAAAVVAIKRRREILGLMVFMAKDYAQPAIRVRVKILSGLNCPVRFTARVGGVTNACERTGLLEMPAD